MNRRTAVATSALLLFSASVYLACGDDDEAKPPPGEADSGGGSDATVDSGGGTDSQATTDVTTTDVASNDAEADTGGNDAAADVQLVGDGGPLSDAGPGGDAAVLNCGNAECNLPSQTCCLYPLLSPPPFFYGQCSNGNACPALAADAGVGDAGTATELQCEVTANCGGGNICCIQGPQNGGGKITSHCLNASACVTTTTQIILDAGPDADGGLDGGFTSNPRAILCDPSAADSGCNVGDAGACSSTNIDTWNLPNGFGTCGGRAR
jgi:hypothetical protein